MIRRPGRAELRAVHYTDRASMERKPLNELAAAVARDISEGAGALEMLGRADQVLSIFTRGSAEVLDILRRMRGEDPTDARMGVEPSAPFQEQMVQLGRLLDYSAREVDRWGEYLRLLKNGIPLGTMSPEDAKRRYAAYLPLRQELRQALIRLQEEMRRISEGYPHRSPRLPDGWSIIK